MLLYNDKEIHQAVTNRLKVYPTFMKLFVYKNPSIERLKGFEDRKLITNTFQTSQIQKENNQERSLRKTKTTIQDIVLSNEFSMFATFTFKSDRQDVNKCKAKMSTWLNNQKTQYGKFKYIIIPEFHKDKKSLHFHALLQGYKGKLKDSGKFINGRKAYNITSYKLGWSTIVMIDNPEKVSSYVRKYITKDMPQFNGKKRYWLSTGLKRPYTDINVNVLHNPFINWTKTYNEKGLEIYRTEDTLKLLSNNERELWQTPNTLNSETKLNLNSSRVKEKRVNGMPYDTPLTTMEMNLQI